MSSHNDDPEETRASDLTEPDSFHYGGTSDEGLTQSYQTRQVNLASSLQPSGPEVNAKIPTAIAEYLIRGQLGRGGFGTVHLAFDQLLQREVALKIPYRLLVKQDQSADMYLREARAMASLDHPHIVPVYRAASAPDIPCYIVTKLIRGCHLGLWNGRNRPTLNQLLSVMLSVADALSYAHKRGVVHRDIKPSNILMDQLDQPYVADFGLALRDVDPAGGPAYVGTAAYMSPEQARGEGHRVDSRSDVFSFGILLYELLTGQKPFSAKVRDDLFDQILFSDPENPCHLNRQLPPALGNVCLKALAKSLSDRYQSIEALANDLRQVQMGQSVGSAQRGSGQTNLDNNAAGPRVVPKGLRPFDAHDAEFFLELLPGPRDREGLPEIVQFWLSRITSTAAQIHVPVGLIYGPSGCGKSSLVRAGILPRIPSQIGGIYVAATATDTERTLIDQIAAALPSHLASTINDQTTVVEAFALVRRAKEKKLVIFIDQFEQWLFTHPECERQGLTQALRQCDGVFLQCILMVRDDFWMGISRLLQALDVTIAEDINITAVDLFDVQHARKVLALFGAAHGRLPAIADEISVGQSGFLDAAVDYLAKDGRVVCVQLALLTEMLKQRSWDKPAGLFAQGGAGIGVRFLEETFDSDSASRRRSIHAEGAHRVLRALLPEAGSRIKGAVRSEEELFQASGYRDQATFNGLLSILDRELHLITPTDRVDEESLSGESSSSDVRAAGYQLTHDFLIVPIRNWIEIRNRTSRRGKAKLRLEEFAELYRARPRRQSLPTLFEFLSIRRYVPSSAWTVPQQQMMAASQKQHLRSVGSALAALLLVMAMLLAVNHWLGQRKAELTGHAAMQSLLNSPIQEAITLASELQTIPYVQRASQQLIDNVQSPDRERVRAALVHQGQPAAVKILAEHVLSANADEAVGLATRIQFPPDILQEMLQTWESQPGEGRLQLRAACVLANSYHAPNPSPAALQWLEHDDDRQRLLRLLLAENPLWLNRWREAFEPISDKLLPLLVNLVKDETRTQSSLNATNLIVGFSGNDLTLLVQLLPYARPAELAVLTESISKHGPQGLSAVAQLSNQLQSNSQVEPELNMPWGSPWWCLGNRQPVTVQVAPLPDATRQRLERCECVIRQRAILAQRLPEAELPELNAELESIGFRVAALAPYYRNGDLLMGVLWVRDGAQSQFRLHDSADQMRKSHAQLSADRMVPDSLAHARGPLGQDKYGCIWIAPPAGSFVQQGDMYFDIHQDQHASQGWEILGNKGLWLPRSSLHLQKADHADYFSSIRWKTHIDDDAYIDGWNIPTAEFDDVSTYSKSLLLVEARKGARYESSTQGVNAIWWRELPIESELLDYQGTRDHLRKAQEKLDQGFYPVGLSAFNDDGQSPPQFSSTWWRPLPDRQSAVQQARRLSRLAVAQFKLGATQAIERALSGQQSEEMRGAIIAAFVDYDLSPNWLIDYVLDDQTPLMMKRSCAWALALIPPARLTAAQLALIEGPLPQLLRQCTDPGMRSALLSIARAWQIKVEADWLTPNQNEFKSLVNDRMVIVRPPQVVWLGSPANEPGRDGRKEPLFPVAIAHPYAISTCEVTLQQYRQFDPQRVNPKNYAQSENCPVINVNWFDAARYCRWLSQQEGISEDQMCYPPLDQIGDGMQLPADFCSRTGYRLPTEAEWEWASRSGALSGRWFGFEPRLLDQYAWTAANADFKIHPVGLLLPNDFGLFDTLGNAKEWTISRERRFPVKCMEACPDWNMQEQHVFNDTHVVTRGGAMLYQPLDARAAQRDAQACSDIRVYMTFRLVRTQAQ